MQVYVADFIVENKNRGSGEERLQRVFSTPQALAKFILGMPDFEFVSAEPFALDPPVPPPEFMKRVMKFRAKHKHQR